MKKETEDKSEKRENQIRSFSISFLKDGVKWNVIQS